jgi:hypothetical protein
LSHIKPLPTVSDTFLYLLFKGKISNHVLKKSGIRKYGLNLEGSKQQRSEKMKYLVHRLNDCEQSSYIPGRSCSYYSCRHVSTQRYNQFLTHKNWSSKTTIIYVCIKHFFKCTEWAHVLCSFPAGRKSCLYILRKTTFPEETQQHFFAPNYSITPLRQNYPLFSSESWNRKKQKKHTWSHHNHYHLPCNILSICFQFIQWCCINDRGHVVLRGIWEHIMNRVFGRSWKWLCVLINSTTKSIIWHST